MHPDFTPDELVLERLPNGDHAWLRPEAHSSEAWQAYRASLKRYVFDVNTRFTLLATSEAEARAWFTSDATEIDVDCDPMDFGTPHLIAVLAMDETMPPRPASALCRWAERIACATRFVLPSNWALVDVAPVALEDLRP